MEQGADTSEGVAKVDLGSLDITGNLVDNESVRNFFQIISGLRGTGKGTEHLIRIPSHADFLIPIIAKTIVSGRDFQPESLSFDQVRAFRPFVADVSWIISRFSRRLAARFNRFVERKGTETLSIATARAIDLVETFGEIESPRDQFLKELQGIHQDLPRFGGFVEGPVVVFTRVLDNLHRTSKDHRFKKGYPLIGNIWGVIPVQVSANYGSTMDIATPEIRSGIALFLKTHGREVNQSRKFRSSNPWRTPAKMIGRDSLRRIPEQMTQVLKAVYRVLPENGPEFKQKIEDFAKNVVNAKEHGVPDREIFQAIFKTINALQ